MQFTETDRENVLRAFEKCDFSRISDRRESFDDILSNINTSTLGDFNYHYGVSKLVIEFQNTDWVVKIPFRYTLWYDQEGYPEQRELTGAGQYGWNYSAVERDLYLHAIEHNVSEFFAETFEIGEIDEHPLYVQEKAPAIGYDEDSIVYEEQTDISDEEERFAARVSNRANICDLEYYQIIKAIKSYGIRQSLRFFKFLNAFCISDLHEGNIGYLPTNGNFKLIDFSDYHS